MEEGREGTVNIKGEEGKYKNGENKCKREWKIDIKEEREINIKKRK